MKQLKKLRRIQRKQQNNIAFKISMRKQDKYTGEQIYAFGDTGIWDNVESVGEDL